ncbi:unnamed protein product [Prunus armeniaca]
MISKLVSKRLKGASLMLRIPPIFLLSAPTRCLTLADETGTTPTGSFGFFLNEDAFLAREEVA